MQQVAGTSQARVASVVIALTLLLGACASASDPASTASETSNETENPAATEPTPAEDTETSSASETEPATDEDAAPGIYVSPIGEALGVTEDEIATGLETYLAEAEELTRSCMAEAGFDYTLVVRGFNQQVEQNALEASLSSEQFAEEYGFGIATLFNRNFEGQGVIDFVNERFGPPPSVERSPGEQAAYEMALNGQTTQGLSAEDAQDQLFDNAAGTGALEGSCRDYGLSTAENPAAANDGLNSLLADELNALFDRFENDPRIREAQSEWQTCMATNGHSYENRFEILDEVFASANELATQYLSSQQILTALGQAQQEGFVTMNGDDRASFLEEVGALEGFSWVPEVQTAHDELVAFELRVAADSLGCSDEDLFEQVQFELETEFVETHADQLALIAAGDS